MRNEKIEVRYREGEGKAFFALIKSEWLRGDGEAFVFL